jgi:hypothetical protein
MVFSIIRNLPTPVPYVEVSEDGNAVYIEPTEQEGFTTIANLKKVRKTLPMMFSNVIGEALVGINNVDELSKLLLQVEKMMNIKISHIGHTLRMSESGDNVNRILIPIEQFRNPYNRIALN